MNNTKTKKLLDLIYGIIWELYDKEVIDSKQLDHYSNMIVELREEEYD